jgi:putative membrane protein
MVLNQDEARRIEDAVGAAETRTSSEIVVCIRQTSGEDRGIAALIGVVILAAVAGLGAALRPDMNTYLLIALALAAGIIAFAVADWLDLGLKLLPAQLLTQEAGQAARAAFLDRGIDATPRRNAVLLFISRAERYVEILPDRGVAAAVPPQHWADIVASFRETAQQKGLVEAVCDAISRIGTVCAGPFPAGSDNPDLKPNAPVTK